jgi:hypothetical protein
MVAMRARATRFEFTIAFIGILVLFLCSKPPEPGTAQVDGDSEPATPELQPVEDGPVDEPLTGVPESLPGVTRMGAVDARNCKDLDYDKVMYGEVTVRWVWNGTRFVPQKVCIVEEENGTSSVWSFDQPGEVVLSEVPDERK